VAAKCWSRDTSQRDETVNEEPVYLPDDREQTASVRCTVYLHSIDSSYDAYAHQYLAYHVTINRHEISVLIYSPVYDNEEESWSRFIKRIHDVEKYRR